MSALRVLVADDERQVRSFIRAVLEKAGFRVLQAVDGIQALSMVEALFGDIGLLLTDYSMPGMDGAALAKRVRGQFPAIPILLISSDGNACHCVSSDAFLAKPFVPSVLVAAVRRLAKRKCD
jgi:CheY-like chemotaxis protein